MTQLLLIIQRLKKPSVLISIFSQIITLLILFGIDIDKGIAITAVTSICSILTLLGILSDPDSQHKGYSDDILVCSHCHKPSQHILINGKYICKECGCEYIPS